VLPPSTSPLRPSNRDRPTPKQNMINDVRSQEVFSGAAAGSYLGDGANRVWSCRRKCIMFFVPSALTSQRARRLSLKYEIRINQRTTAGEY